MTDEPINGYIIRKSGKSYQVLDTANNMISRGKYQTRKQAEERLDRILTNEPNAKPRPCIRCRDTFRSAGIGNRICPRCTAAVNDLNDVGA